MNIVEQQHQVKQGMAIALAWAMHQFSTRPGRAPGPHRLHANDVLIIFGNNDDALQNWLRKFQGYFFVGTGV